ncbi:MAG: RHS repeat-associated core domain-containing protein, partial [Salibacteraceae bacterium]
TIHGWLKGSNAESLNYLRDIGRDGDQTTSDNRNQLVGQDAFGYSLRYYGNDYTSIGFTNFLAAESTAPTWAEWDLFNGNIKAMTTALSNYNEAPMQVLRNHYRYDEMHRLKEMRAHIAHTDLRDLNTWDNTTASNEYHVTVSYDANGNIGNLSRNGNQTDGLPMDRLRYHYIDGTNQLEYVDDNHPVAPATASVYTRDLEDQSSGNYAYDATGQLIQDNQEEIESSERTASGKIRAVNRTATSTKPNLYFEYDALDNRILKLVKPRDGGVLSNEGDWVYTHYVRDGEGNLLATYEQTAPQVGSGTPATTEVKLPSGNLTNQFVQLRVGTTDLMDMAVTWQGSFAATLQAVDDEVNNGAASVAGWSAIVFANKIKLFAPTDNPTQYNNLQIFNNYSGSGTAMNLGLVPQLSGGTAGDPIYHKQLSHEEHHIYGTARHGIHKSKKPMYSSHQVIADLAIDGSFAPGSAQVLYTTDVSEAPKRKRILGRKVYELANHLGNVLVTVSDKKLPYEETDNVNGGIQPVFDPMKIQYDPQANTYTKISTTPGWNAGGHSTQTSQGACWAEFTIAAPASVNNGLAVGLSFDPHSGEHYNTIDYSITVYMAGGQLRALPYHFGQSLGSPVNVAPGDVLRISRVGTSIRFFKNGSSPYQWQQQINISATDPMLIDFSIRDENTSITGLTIAGFSQDVMGYTADVISHSDYYPFGMTMSARTAYDTEYRYGFNGMERDDEINGGSSYTSHWRGYDPRLGRWLSTDPMEAKYPSMSPYSSNFNNPIVFIDPDGDDPFLGVIDAITAFIVESGTNFLSNWLISGMTPSQAFDNIQWSSAAWEAGKAYAFSWFTPTGSAAARMIYKVGKTRIGRLTITIVDEFVTEALKKYSLGDYNDEDGDFDYEKILNTNELTKLFIHSTLGALINSGSIEQARRFKEQMIKLNKDHAPIFDKFMRQLQGEKGSLKHTHSKLDNIVQKQKNLTTNRVIDKAKGGAKSTAVQDISNKAAEKLFPSNGSESKPVRASSSSGNETKPARASSTQGTSTNRKVPAKAGSGREIRIIKNKNRGAIF